MKVHKRKWHDPRWTGPWEVVLATSHAVKVKKPGDELWHHLNLCAPAKVPSRTLGEIRTDLSNSQ